MIGRTDVTTGMAAILPLRQGGRHLEPARSSLGGPASMGAGAGFGSSSKYPAT